MKFTDAVLTDASLDGTNLPGASFMRSDLRGADLTGAYLVGADLQDAKLDGTRLDDAVLVRARWTDGRICATGSVGAGPSGRSRRSSATASIAGSCAGPPGAR